MVTEPWASGLCGLVFWCRDAGPSLTENVTCFGTANTSVEEYIFLTLVNSVLLGMDYFDSGPGFRNLTQTHLLKPSELTHKLPRDVVEASIPVLSCGITNESTCADQTQMVTEPWASGLCVLVFWCRDAGPSLAKNETVLSEMECNLDEDSHCSGRVVVITYNCL